MTTNGTPHERAPRDLEPVQKAAEVLAKLELLDAKTDVMAGSAVLTIDDEGDGALLLDGIPEIQVSKGAIVTDGYLYDIDITRWSSDSGYPEQAWVSTGLSGMRFEDIEQVNPFIREVVTWLFRYTLKGTDNYQRAVHRVRSEIVLAGIADGSLSEDEAARLYEYLESRRPKGLEGTSEDSPQVGRELIHDKDYKNKRQAALSSYVQERQTADIVAPAIVQSIGQKRFRSSEAGETYGKYVELTVPTIRTGRVVLMEGKVSYPSRWLDRYGMEKTGVITRQATVEEILKYFDDGYAPGTVSQVTVRRADYRAENEYTLTVADDIHPNQLARLAAQRAYPTYTNYRSHNNFQRTVVRSLVKIARNNIYRSLAKDPDSICDDPVEGNYTIGER